VDILFQKKEKNMLMKITSKFIFGISPRLFVRNLLIILLIILAYSQPIYSQTKPDVNRSMAISMSLSEIVAGGEAPGMIAAIISGEGVIAIGSAGVRKVGSDIAITSNDIIHLGSCTKAMTSTMIATLVAEGKLSWDMKLIEAIPELKKSFHPDFQNITLWQLLTHRAGLPLNPRK
jgi:CubicO group peptidase (beta-lactamase class C family)